MAWLPNYTTRRRLTVDPTKVDATLTDFPILVKLTSANFDFTKSTATGNDIRFTLADGTTLLSYERERHDVGAGKAEYWVKIPSVSATANTIFYIYYGNAGATDGANPTAVWDANTVARWGLQENPAGTVPQMKDSTLNDDGTTHGGMTSADSVEGKIGRALDFDGANDRVEVPDSASLDISYATIEMWVKPTMALNDALGRFLIDKRNPVGWTGEYNAYMRGNGDIDVAFKTTGGSVWFNGAPGLIPMNEWSHLIFTWDGSTLKVFRNGAVIGTASGSGTIVNNTQSLKIGTRSDNFGFFNGSIDEVRISNIARSPAWIKATHNTGNDTLLTYGAEEVQKLVSDAGSGIDTIGVKSSIGIFDTGIARKKSSNALSFDGVDDYVNCGNDASLNLTRYTVEMWIRVSDPPPAEHTTLLAKGGYGNANYTLFYRHSVRSIGHLTTVNGVRSWFSTPNNSAPMGEWLHIVGTFDGIDARTYTNAVERASQNKPGDATPIVDPLYIGSIAGASPFNGLIDEVRIYNRALSAEEVKEHYDGIFRDETGLVGLWHFDEGSGTVANDNSGQGNHGTLLPSGGEPTWVTPGAPYQAELIGTLAKIAISDTSIGQDIVKALAKIALTDTGSGIDAIQILKRIAVSDSGVAVDAVKVLVRIALTDEGVGTDAAKILVSLYVSDIGIGTDVLEVIKRIIPYLKKKYPYLEKKYPYLKRKYPYLHKGKIIR